MNSKPPIAIYIHWPFCRSKCPYCDFNSHVSANINHTEWLAAYLREIDYFSDVIEGREISSIFFGGGTPTLMQPFIAEGLLNRLARDNRFAKDIEITLEGNPTSAEANKFHAFKAAGVNRVSVGIQSLNDDELKFLGREHSVKEALNVVDVAANIFNNYSFDLIYCLPGQKLADWEQTLKKAIGYTKHHLSLYQLTIEKGTQFYSDYKNKKFTMPDDELAADFYQLTDSFMQNAGFPAYEVSNYARKGAESRHNLSYWRYGDYLGIGPGAHSRITENGSKISQMMVHNPQKWLQSVSADGHGIQDRGILSKDETVEEMVMMGLRIKEGISRENFLAVTGYKLEERLKNINELCVAGLLEQDEHTVKATDKGMLLVNSITGKLLS